MRGSSFIEASLTRNNLNNSSSPYLLQHRNNPVWWQEWSEELLNYCRSAKKLLFVSSGYTTCHWCHVMASEAFSDPETADYLNSHFICIKVDREQRPDIDQFMMDFINSQNGRGGWPLNVFMTADLRPVFALTYAPVRSESTYTFLGIAQKVIEFYEKNSEKIPPYFAEERKSEIAEESAISKTLSKYYDPENGGFGTGQKFPPHSSLLYLLFQPGIEDSPSTKTICAKTLDAMYMGGLNDHLQGGIFRYCIDREWTIPHFEKMLYDQAMALWCYSLAYRVLGKTSYKNMAEKILLCLDQCFKTEGMYRTGLDADTDHEEGITYLWYYEELTKSLTPEEFKKFSGSYFIDKEGNFNGLIHLVRLNDEPLQEIESKLLDVRKLRAQPSRDDKILSGINALLVIALLQAARFLEKPGLEKDAAVLMKNILKRFWDGKTLKHSYFRESFEEINFLFDAAAILTALTMLFESDPGWKDQMFAISDYVETFREGDRWKESSARDFQTIYASWSDHPVPSSVSLAEMGLIRTKLLTGSDSFIKEYREPFLSDFYNIAVMISNGLFHLFESSHELPWDKLPVNSLRMKGIHETDCFMGVCTPL